MSREMIPVTLLELRQRSPTSTMGSGVMAEFLPEVGAKHPSKLGAVVGVPHPKHCAKIGIA